MNELGLYSLDEIAELLKVSKQTVTRYVKAGKIKAVKYGRSWYVSKENFENFLQGN